MQKKIQDLTLREVETMCKKHLKCDECPLYRKTVVNFENTRRVVYRCAVEPLYPQDWHISKYRTEVEVE